MIVDERALSIMKAEVMLSKLDKVGPMRMTKMLPSGNIAILQVADPEAVPERTKIIRQIPGKIGKWLRSVEAAMRVGKIVYLNSMRGGDKIRQGNSRADRKGA